MASIDSKYKQIKIDHNYVITAYGEIYDYSGKEFECGHLNELLCNPSPKTAYNILHWILSYLFVNGYDTGDKEARLPVADDPTLLEIKERYDLSET